MKHFINILLILVMVFFAIAIAYLQHYDMLHGIHSAWWHLYLPWMVLAFMLSIKLYENYQNY